MIHRFLLTALLLFIGVTSVAAEEECPCSVLPVEQAFVLSATVSPANTLLMTWTMPPNVYLYGSQFQVHSHDDIQIAAPLLPPGTLHSDAFFGEQRVYYGPEVQASIPMIAHGVANTEVEVAYQGCSDSGYCYPPLEARVSVDFDGAGNPIAASLVSAHENFTMVPQEPVVQTTPLSEQDKITYLLAESSLLWVVLAFLGFGLLLMFTPCVLPMLPILSSVVLGHGQQLTKRKAFLLASSYVIGMALTYAVIGVMAGLAGASLQAAFQKPWVILLFSALFVLLALSMFGLYELRLPVRMEEKLANARQRQQGGHYIGVILMGVLSALIVSPCITAPLVGALAYIGQTGDAMLGGAALLSLGLGMGIPLIIVVTMGAQYLPKAGAWMNTVRSVFGVLLLVVAIWLLERIMLGPVTLFLWASLLVVTAVYLGALEAARQGWQRFWKGIGIILFVYGLVLLLGAAMGNSNPLRPLAGFNLAAGTSSELSSSVEKITVKSVADVQEQLLLAEMTGKLAVLDFYADWCAACIYMDRVTFANPDVQAALQGYVFLQADVTANDKVDKALQQYFSVYAPPSILFFDAQGNEMKDFRIVGEMGPQAFLKHLLTLPEVGG